LDSIKLLTRQAPLGGFVGAKIVIYFFRTKKKYVFFDYEEKSQHDAERLQTMPE